ncbi:TPA: hypothetical protein ACRTTK_003137 [Aeromonas hydrophila]|nr:hypothetical protein [Aeromonas hydrophila]
MSMIDLFAIKTISDLEALTSKILGMDIHHSQKRICIDKVTRHWLRTCNQ